MWEHFPGVWAFLRGVMRLPGVEAFPRCGGEFLRCGSVSQVSGRFPGVPAKSSPEIIHTLYMYIM